MPEEEWDILKKALTTLMIRNERGELMAYLLNAHEPEEIDYHAWVRFTYDCDWYECVRMFSRMPTTVLDTFLQKEWKRYTRTLDEDGLEQISEAMKQRNDFYGETSRNLPFNFFLEIVLV